MFLIEEDLANKIINYLAAQKYIDVFQMVAGLQALRRPEVKKKKTTTEDKNAKETLP